MTTKNFVSDYGAAVAPTDSSAALASWLTFAAANDGSTLVIPAGSYHWASTNGPTNGLTNATISATGATVDSLFIGNAGVVRQDYVHSARFKTVSAGATSIELVTGSEISRFAVNGYIMIAGLGTQTGASYPPNFQYSEYRRITGIAGAFISFTEPLLFSYKSTWPLVDRTAAQTTDLGGPGTVYALLDCFGGTHTYTGLTCTQSAGVSGGGSLSIVLNNMTFTGNGPSPSQSKSYVINNSSIGTQNEVDKSVEYLEYNNCTGTQIYAASSSTTSLVIKGGSNITTLNGTPWNTTISGASTIGTLYGGSAGFGRSNNLDISANSTVTTSQTATHQILLSDLSFSNGIFTVANAGNLYDTLRLFVPGFLYAIGYSAGDNVIHITGADSRVYRFRVLDMTQDGTNTYISTNMIAMPTTTFIGNTANAIFAYGVKTLSDTSPSAVRSALAFVEPVDNTLNTQLRIHG